MLRKNILIFFAGPLTSKVPCSTSKEKQKSKHTLKRKRQESDLFFTEQELRAERIKRIMEEDREIAEVKLQHEKTMAKIKEEHLKEINRIQIQHMKEIQKLEIEINKAKLTSIQKENIRPL